jgi:hypothetical protein
MNELWKKIKDYPNYLVSNTGKVKCLSYGKAKKEADLKLTKDKSGHLVCNLTNSLDRKTYRADIIVLETFSPIEHPEIELEQEPFHIDGDKVNNHVSNLSWITKIFKPIDPNDKRRRKGKLHHKFGVKTPDLTRVKMALNHNKDKTHPNYKLTDKQVFEIKKRRYEGDDLETLAIEFKQSIANISYITTGRRRKKIAIEYTMVFRVRNK